MNNKRNSKSFNTAGYRKDLYDHYVVQEEAPLLEWLLANLKGSRTKIKATLQGYGIKVNGKFVTRYDYPLVPGIKIALSKTKRNKVLKSRYVKIVYEDDYIIVVEKSVGILSMGHGQRSFNVKSVLDEYFHETKQPCRAHVIHRLDRDTSGLMVYAKDKKLEVSMHAEWQKTVLDRRYVGVLSGVREDDDGTIATWRKDNKSYFTYSSPVDNGGKYAVTHFYTLDRSPRYSLVEFKLETGRKNQIRVHAADMSHPVCGDFKYGNGDDPIGRLCLHA